MQAHIQNGGRLSMKVRLLNKMNDTNDMFLRETFVKVDKEFHPISIHYYSETNFSMKCSVNYRVE